MSDDNSGGAPPGGEELSDNKPAQTPPPSEGQADSSMGADTPYADDPYGGAGASGSAEPTPVVAPTSVAVVASGGQTPPPKPPPPLPAGDEEEGMLRMSFMDHLSELRKRVIKCLWGFGRGFILSMV